MMCHSRIAALGLMAAAACGPDREPDGTELGQEGCWAETVLEIDSSPDGSAPLVVDAAGGSHVIFQDSDGLRYGADDGSGWSIEIIDESPSMGSGSALAVDRRGTVHVVYVGSGVVDFRNAMVHIALRDGVWEKDTLDTVYDSPRSPSIAVDAEGRLHVAFESKWGPGLYYATRGPDDDGWAVETIETAYYARHAAVGVDAEGAPHVLFLRSDNNMSSTEIFHATKVDGAWMTEPLDAAEPGGSTALAFGPDGLLHVAFSRDGTLRHAIQTADGWRSDWVDGSGGLSPSLAIDADGVAHIAYVSARSFELRNATEGLGLWTRERLHPGVEMMSSSLAIAPGGELSLAYYRVSGGGLTVARRTCD